MRRKHRAVPCTTAGLLTTILIAGLGAGAGAELVATPGVVVFQSTQETTDVTLTADGEALPADAIEGWKLVASGHDYNHMLSFKPTDGKVTISPTDDAEIGSYELEIDTTKGDATVYVYTPFGKMSTLKEEAERAGIPVAELKKRKGLAEELPYAVVDLNIPPLYYEGQTLRLTVPRVEDNTCRWLINGILVKEGPGEASLEFTFPKPGVYVVDYIEQKDGATVASAHEHTTAVALPPILVEVQAGEELALQAPHDYQSYAWSVDGAPVPDDKVFRHTFEEAGAHVVECLATEPIIGDPDGFLHWTYQVQVTE